MYPASVLATTASPKMSSRYVHVSTKDVIDIMTSEGYQVAEVKTDKVRKSSAEFGRHLVKFTRPGAQVVDGYEPQMLWTNSHNGTTKATMMLGAYRFVCSNGLVIGQSYATESIRHTGDLAREVIDRVRALSASSYKLFGQIENWSKVELTGEKLNEYVRQAAILRFGEERMQMYKPEDLLELRRAEDDKGDLWSVFNRVQENCMKGGQVGHNANNRQVRARALKGINADIGFNTKLWDLTSEFATT